MKFLKLVHHIGEIILQVLCLSIDNNKDGMHFAVGIFSDTSSTNIIGINVNFGGVAQQSNQLDKSRVIGDYKLVEDYWIAMLNINNEFQYGVFTK